MRQRWLIAIICLLLVAQIAGISHAQSHQAKHLVVLHVNDTHGRFSPRQTAAGRSIGGMARLATLIKQVRRANEGNTLVLHAGDLMSRGEPPTVYYGGEPNLMVMQAIGYDAFVPGNGEFYFGLPNLRRQTALVRFPVLFANAIDRDSQERIFQPYVIKEVAGIKVAILGLGFIRESHPATGNAQLQDAIAVAQKFAPILRKQVDLLIALTHIGLTQDQQLAAQVPALDIIVGGHSHSRLDAPVLVPRSEEPTDGNVVVVQAGDYLDHVGRLDMKLRSGESGKYAVTELEWTKLPIGDHLPDDAEVVKILRRYSEPMQEVIATAEVALEHPSVGPSPMATLVAHAMQRVADADIVLVERGSIARGIAAGPITITDACQVHPWRNRVLQLELTGEQLRTALAAHDLLVTGCTFRKTEGVVSELMRDGTSIGFEQRLKVAASEYLVKSSETLRAIPSQDTGEQIDTALIKHLRHVRVVTAADEGR